MKQVLSLWVSVDTALFHFGFILVQLTFAIFVYLQEINSIHSIFVLSGKMCQILFLCQIPLFWANIPRVAPEGVCPSPPNFQGSYQGGDTISLWGAAYQ